MMLIDIFFKINIYQIIAIREQYKQKDKVRLYEIY